jgi:outer membrane receptor for ferrienterochelin and colicins
MSQCHRFSACRALAATSIVYLTCAFAPVYAAAETEAADSASNPGSSPPALDEVVVIAQHLNEARNGIQTQTGASTYTINEAAIGAEPGGDNQLLNQVIMQAPDVAQDSFGQFHVRGEHNGLQYRLNGGHQRLRPIARPAPDFLAHPGHWSAAGRVRPAHRGHH